VTPTLVTPLQIRAAEKGCKNPRFLGFYKKKQNPQKSKFQALRFFFTKTLKIQILGSQSQQKIVAFQSY